MYELPTSVEVNNQIFNIRNGADYRTILAVIDLCQDVELTQEERMVSALLVFYEGLSDVDDIDLFGENLDEAISAMMNFISCNKDEEIGAKSNHKLIDWVQDEKLIVSAINNVAKTEIRALPYLHWWTFISYYMSIGECTLSTVVGIRDKVARGKKLEKYEQEFKRENPQYFRWKNDELEADNLLATIWNQDKKGGNE